MRPDQKARMAEAIQLWMDKECEGEGMGFWLHPNTAHLLANVLEATCDACVRASEEPE